MFEPAGRFPADTHADQRVKVMRRAGEYSGGTRLYSTIEKAEDFIEAGEKSGLEVRVYVADIVWRRIQ